MFSPSELTAQQHAKCSLTAHQKTGKAHLTSTSVPPRYFCALKISKIFLIRVCAQIKPVYRLGLDGDITLIIVPSNRRSTNRKPGDAKANLRNFKLRLQLCSEEPEKVKVRGVQAIRKTSCRSSGENHTELTKL